MRVRICLTGNDGSDKRGDSQKAMRGRRNRGSLQIRRAKPIFSLLFSSPSSPFVHLDVIQETKVSADAESIPFHFIAIVESATFRTELMDSALGEFLRTRAAREGSNKWGEILYIHPRPST